MNAKVLWQEPELSMDQLFIDSEICLGSSCLNPLRKYNILMQTRNSLIPNSISTENVLSHALIRLSYRHPVNVQKGEFSVSCLKALQMLLPWRGSSYEMVWVKFPLRERNREDSRLLEIEKYTLHWWSLQTV